MRGFFASFIVFYSLFNSASSHAVEKIKIGFVLSTLQEERYLKDQKYFKDEADKLGFEALVVSADNNSRKPFSTSILARELITKASSGIPNFFLDSNRFG